MATSQLEWASPTTGLWIGRRDGRFSGVIEVRFDGYVANTGTREEFFPTMEAARASFEAAA